MEEAYSRAGLMCCCVVLICKEGIVVMGVCFRRFCLNMSVDGDICLF